MGWTVKGISEHSYVLIRSTQPNVNYEFPSMTYRKLFCPLEYTYNSYDERAVWTNRS